MAWAPDYLTVAQLKSYVRVDDTVDDAELATVITAASRAVDGYCNRQFGKVAAPEERTYQVGFNRRLYRWVADIDDLQTTAGLTVTVDGVTVTDYVLEPRNAVVKGMAWTRLVLGASVSVADLEVSPVAPWGWTAAPTAVIQAATLQASRFSARRDSPYGVAGSPDAGNELRLLSKVDPDVGVALYAYRRKRRLG